MKVSLKWLSEYTAVPVDLKAFCDRLDLTGTGVEGVEKTGEASRALWWDTCSPASRIRIPTTCTW